MTTESQMDPATSTNKKHIYIKQGLIFTNMNTFKKISETLCSSNQGLKLDFFRSLVAR